MDVDHRGSRGWKVCVCACVGWICMVFAALHRHLASCGGKEGRVEAFTGR